MGDAQPVVVDSSVGVKWFASELGRDAAVELLRQHERGEVSIVVPDLFVYEVLRTAKRKDPALPAAVRRFFSHAVIATVPPDDDLIAAALEQAEALGCDLYDAYPAGLAAMLDAPLYSADARAHSRYPNVVLIGE